MGKFYETVDFNPVHTHGGDYSFVIFLDVPKILKKNKMSLKAHLPNLVVLCLNLQQQNQMGIYRQCS